MIARQYFCEMKLISPDNFLRTHPRIWINDSFRGA